MSHTLIDMLDTFNAYWLNADPVSNDTLSGFKKYCTSLQKHFTGEQKVIALLTETMLLRSSNKHIEADELVSACRRRFNRIKDPLYAHRWKRMQLVDEMRMGNTAKIYDDVKQLAAQAEEEGWYHEQMRALVLIHLVESYMGHFKKAMESAVRRRQLAVEHGDINNQREAIINIAHTYQRFKHKQQALNELEKAKPLFTDDLKQPLHLHYYMLLAVSYHENDFVSKAFAINKNLLAFLKKGEVENSAIYISAASNVAITYLEKGEYAEAEKQFLEIHDYVNKNNWQYYRLDIAVHLCDVYYPWKKYDKMLIWLKKAEKLVKEVTLPEFEVRVIKLRALYEKAIGNTAFALSYFEKYHNRFVQWKAIDDAEKIKALEMKYELEQEQLKQEVMKKENELQQQQLQMLNSFIAQKDKLINEFASQYKELETTGLKRKAIFERLNEMVRNVEFTAQEERESYSAKFNKAHQKSVNDLQAAYPKLSHNESKIAIMLSQGLSNKEIARLTLTTLRNIETTRLRMRKKMNLMHKDDLIKKIRKAIA